MTTIQIGGITWQDGELSGDADQLAELRAFMALHENPNVKMGVIRDGVASDDGRLPVFGNGPWVTPSLTEPFGFLAAAQAALGVHEWTSEGLVMPPFAVNPSDQDDVIA